MRKPRIVLPGIPTWADHLTVERAAVPALEAWAAAAVSRLRARGAWPNRKLRKILRAIARRRWDLNRMEEDERTPTGEKLTRQRELVNYGERVRAADVERARRV